MARTLVNFGELRLDDAPHATDGLTAASGVYVLGNGYGPIGAFSEFAEALAGDFKGGGAFISTGGTPRTIAGDATDLYSLDAGEWTSVLGTLTVTGRWRFTQFGDNVICTNGGAPVDYDLTADTAAALSGSPPTADFCATVRDFVVLGRAGGVNIDVTWSGQGDAEEWTPGTALSGLQPLYSGGKIMGLTGGELGHIIQRFGVTRMTFTGDATDPWQFDNVNVNSGCSAEGSVIQTKSLFFYYGDGGFQMFDGANYLPIGANRVDRTFAQSYSQTELENSLWSCADEERKVAIWIMPQKVWMYSWAQPGGRWTTAELPIQSGFLSFTEPVSIDDLDGLYGDLDSIPLSLDDPRFSGGAPRFTLVHTDGRFGALNGANIAARFETPRIELGGSREARVKIVRPLTDAVSGLTLTADSRKRLGDAESISTFTQLNSRGDMPARIAARHLMLALDIAAGTTWDYCQGLEIEHEMGGRG